MNQDLVRGRPLQRFADFALGGTAGLLGMLLLGATILHLLAPVAVRTPGLEPAAFATTVGSFHKPLRAAGGAAKARPASARASSGSTSAARSGARRGKLAAHGLRREHDNPYARHSGLAAAHALGAARMPAPTLHPAPVAAHGLRPVPVAAHASRLAAVSAHAASHPVLLTVRVTHSARMAAHVPRAAPAAARRRSPHSVPQVARFSRAGGRDAGVRKAASRSRFSAKAMQPPLGYDVRASFARVPIDALPAAPVATTPVRGRVPPASASTAAALDRRQDVALPSP